MEVLGARSGRSSTRYGPTTVFSGPVRKWKKKWVPSSSSSPANPKHTPSNPDNTNSNLFLYKWTAASGEDSTAAPATLPDDPPRRRFRYVPVSVIEEQNQEASSKSDDENKVSDADQPTQIDGSDQKPDVNDVSMEDAQVTEKDQAPMEEVNETKLDLSLGLNAHDGSDSKMVEQDEDGGWLERLSSG